MEVRNNEHAEELKSMVMPILAEAGILTETYEEKEQRISNEINEAVSRIHLR